MSLTENVAGIFIICRRIANIRRFLLEPRVPKTFLLLWLIVLLAPSAGSAGGARVNAGKGEVQFGAFADSLDRAFISDYVEHEEFYADSQRDFPWKIEDLHVGYHDLNDDGVPELFVSYTDVSASHCGTGGCEQLIFEMRDGRWELLLSSISFGFWISDEIVKGYRTFYTSHGLVSTTKWEWDGTEYRYSCVENMPAETGSNVKTRCD